jgi:hypothetical protein
VNCHGVVRTPEIGEVGGRLASAAVRFRAGQASRSIEAAIGAGGNEPQLAGLKMAHITWRGRNIGRRESHNWARYTPACQGSAELLVGLVQRTRLRVN